MTRWTTRRRALALPMALIGLIATAAPAWGQARITWVVDQPYQVKELWSMNPDGSNRVSLVPGGFTASAPYSEIGEIAGPSVGTYPLDPFDPASPRVQWFLTNLKAQVGDEFLSHLFAFAPDGQGGVVWRRLSAQPYEAEPGVLVSLGRMTLPTSPDDSFASLIVSRMYFDGPTFEESTTRISSTELVVLSSPFERLEDSVTLADFEPVIPERFNVSSLSTYQHSWSPDGGTVAYIGSQSYPDGSSQRALRTYEVATGIDRVLVDRLVTGLSATYPRWAPNGSEIAFFNGNFVGNEQAVGTYAVHPVSGMIRAIATKGKSSNYVSQPVWSPDGSLMVGVQFYRGLNTNLQNRYSVVRFPAAGISRKNGIVSLTPTSDPYRYHAILNWR
ncbi:TolB family protein [Tautonia marina]|uniref:TolB family protein n=1 Tax=Tautonia marina TaxID=2653855 RepID=UPI0012610343|nr:hypothetical protein [Tautonia marina]